VDLALALIQDPVLQEDGETVALLVIDELDQIEGLPVVGFIDEQIVVVDTGVRLAQSDPDVVGVPIA
jgi:hypothetical protein